MRNLTYEHLSGMSVAEIAALPPAVLADLADEIRTAETLLKSNKERFAEGLDRRYGEAATEARLAAGKDTGTVRFQDGDYIVVADRDKRVTWEQSKLMAALDTLSDADAKHYAKFKVEIEERKYSAAPPALRALFEPCRTVTPGKATYKLEHKSAEAA